MAEEEIKEAFKKVKQDMASLNNEIYKIKLYLSELKSQIKLTTEALKDMKNAQNPTNRQTNQQTDTPTHKQTDKRIIPTVPTHIPTHPAIPTHIPTDNYHLKALKRQDTESSTGNEGVPTDKQTNRQTNQHIFQHINSRENAQNKEEIQLKFNKENKLNNAAEIINTLDSLKKELRLKIKRLTMQEMQVFSLLYSLEEQEDEVDYRILATKTNLSESSIRDYIGKITKKGFPIIKEKLNNKRVILHISQDLKKLASLDTILKLREI